jgi:hypothetical protein
MVKRLLAGQAPSSQSVGSLLRPLWPAKLARKIQQKVMQQIFFNGKMHSTTFE